MEGAEAENPALSGLRDKLLKLSGQERQQSSFPRKVELRKKMTALVVNYCRGGESLEMNSRQLCAQLHSAEAPPDFAYALFSALQNTPGESHCGLLDGGGDRSKLCKYVFEELLLWVRDRDSEGSRSSDAVLGALTKGLGVIGEGYVPVVLDEIVSTFDEAVEGSDLTGLLEVIPFAVRRLAEPSAGGGGGMGDAGASCPELPMWCSGAHEGRLNPKIFQTKVVEHVCALNWKPAQAAAVVGALRELKLTEEDLTALIRKTMSCCLGTDLQNVPALVYQILLASLQGKADTALKGVAKLFERLERKHWAQGEDRGVLLTVEGTVLLQLNIIAKQKQTLAQTLVRALRESPSAPLKPFLFGMLLSLARVAKCEKHVFDYLQDAVLAHYSCKGPKLPCRSWGALQSAQEGQSFESLVDDMVSRSHEWDITIQGLVDFGKSLVRATGVGARDRVGLLVGGAAGEGNPLLMRIMLGVYILTRAFESHDAVRSDILKQCQQEILNDSDCSIYYIHLLARLCIECKPAVAEHSGLVKECLDCFLVILPGVAVHFFISILPLLACTADLKNYAVIVLRKAMFSRNYDHRLTAVKCLMHLALADALPDFRTLVGSHASCSQQSQVNLSASIGEVGHDLLGFLRKGLKQQYSLRKMLYTGFAELARLKPALSNQAFEMLLPHFHGFYEQDKDLQPPLRIEKCSSVVASRFRPVEPLHSLVFCVQNLTRAFGEERQEWMGFGSQGSRSPACTRMIQDYGNLHQRMLNANLEDFGIDKSMDLDVSTPAGQSNLHACQIVLGCLEAMMDMEALNMDKLTGTPRWSARGLYQLFEMHNRLSKIVEKRVKPKKDGADAGTADFFRDCEDNKVTYMRASSLVYFLDVLRAGEFASMSQLPTDNPQQSYTQGTGTKLARCSKFRLFILRQCNSILGAVSRAEVHHAKTRLACGGSAQKEQIVRDVLKLEGQVDWFDLGMPLFKTCETFILAECNVRRNGASSQQHRSNQEEGQLLLEACVSIEKLASTAVSSDQFVQKFSQHSCRGELEGIQGISAADDQPPCVYFYAHLHQLLLRLVESRFFKEAEVVANAIFRLSSCHPRELGSLASGLAYRVLQMSETDHNGFIKAAIAIGVSFSSPPGDMDFCKEVFRDLDHYLQRYEYSGDPTQSQKKEGSYRGIVREKTAHGVVVGILSHCCDVTDDVVQRISKTRSALDPSVPQRLTHVLDLTRRFCKLAPETAVDSIMRLLAKIYKAIGDMAKRMIANKGTRSIHSSFVDLCEAYMHDLTAEVYEYIMVINDEILPDGEDEDWEKENLDRGRADKRVVSNLKKEAKRVPNLIYSIEDCERKLIVLSKANGVNLMKNAKRSTARSVKFKDLEMPSSKRARSE